MTVVVTLARSSPSLVLPSTPPSARGSESNDRVAGSVRAHVSGVDNNNIIIITVLFSDGYYSSYLLIVLLKRNETKILYPAMGGKREE